MKYCSKACRRKIERIAEKAAHVPKSLLRTCVECGSSFERKGMRDKVCSDACRLSARRKRESNVVYLTPAIFDSWFKKAA